MRKNNIITLHYDGEEINKHDFRPGRKRGVNRPEVVDEYINPNDWRVNLWYEKVNKLEEEAVEEYYSDKDDLAPKGDSLSSFTKYLIKILR